MTASFTRALRIVPETANANHRFVVPPAARAVYFKREALSGGRDRRRASARLTRCTEPDEQDGGDVKRIAGGGFQLGWTLKAGDTVDVSAERQLKTQFDTESRRYVGLRGCGLPGD